MPLLNNNNDWDFSVPVRHPNDANNESMDFLNDLQLLENELYHHDNRENSIVVDEAPSPLDMVGQADTAAYRPTRTKKPPQSLFYQTYQELQTTTSAATTTNCLDTSFVTSCSSRPLLEHDENENENGLLIHNHSIVETPATTDDPKMVMTTTTPHASPSRTKNAKTPRTNNTKGRKKKRTHLHASTIPPPSCPLDFLLSSSHEEKSSPTSIVDIFADLEQMESHFDSVATSSIVSTTLGSMDTPIALNHDYEEEEMENPYYTEQDEYNNNIASRNEQEEKQDEYCTIRGVTVDYATLQEEFQKILIKEERESAQEECKDSDSHDAKHVRQVADNNSRVQDEYTPTTNLYNKKNAVVIENEGSAVYKWHSNKCRKRTNRPMIISNGTKAVFHYNVVMTTTPNDEYMCQNACPTMH